MVAKGLGYNCGMLYLVDHLSGITDTKDRKIFLARFLAKLVKALLHGNGRRIVIAILESEERFLIPYYAHLGFRLAGEFGGITLMSKYFSRPPSQLRGGVGKAIRYLRNLEKRHNICSYQISVHRGNANQFMWSCPANKIDEYRQKLADEMKTLDKEMHEFLIALPSEYLGYWKRFSEDDSRAVADAWPN